MKFYNTISPFYHIIDIFLNPYKKDLIKILKDLSSSDILDMGVGQAQYIQHLQHHRFIGIDNAEKMLNKAQSLHIPHLKLYLMDAHHLEFKDNTFDIVIMNHVLSVVKHPESVLMEAHRVLKPGGLLFILNQMKPSYIPDFIAKSINIFSKRLLKFNFIFHVNQLENLRSFKFVQVIQYPFSAIQLHIYSKF